jgi:hypothetical protein
MASSSVDHFVAITVFLAATLLFIGLFNQTIQPAIIYQRNRSVATKTSDLLDSILLNPGKPITWGQTNDAPIVFGLQDPEFTQYRISPYSLMRLQSSIGQPVYYPMTGQTYSNITMGFGQSLLVPLNETIDYNTVSRLLGINGTYGFSLTMTPIVTVSISESQANPLTLEIDVAGAGSPLGYATISYCFMLIDGRDAGYPTYSIEYGDTITDNTGKATLIFPKFDGEKQSYVLLAYAHLSGLMGVGYYEHNKYTGSYVVPFISNFETGEITLAHSGDIYEIDDQAAIHYNATFVLLSEDLTLREMPLDSKTGKIVGLLNSGMDPSHAYTNLKINTHNPGILIVSYSKSAQESGVVIMPWGISSLAFPVSFGGNQETQEWVATDIRQVLINGVAYQAKLAAWSLEGYQVIS